MYLLGEVAWIGCKFDVIIEFCSWSCFALFKNSCFALCALKNLNDKTPAITAKPPIEAPTAIIKVWSSGVISTITGDTVGKYVGDEVVGCFVGAVVIGAVVGAAVVGEVLGVAVKGEFDGLLVVGAIDGWFVGSNVGCWVPVVEIHKPKATYGNVTSPSSLSNSSIITLSESPSNTQVVQPLPIPLSLYLFKLFFVNI